MNNFDKSAVRYASNTKRNNLRSSYLGMCVSVFAVLLCFMLIVSLVRKTASGDPLTFSSLLNWLGNLRSFSLQVNISDFTIVADWGLFNFLRNFLNIFTTSFGILYFLGANLINLLIFIGQFLLFIFV